MLVAESVDTQPLEVVLGDGPRLVGELLGEVVERLIGRTDPGIATVPLEAIDEGVVFDLGPEVVSVGLGSIVTLVGCRHDDSQHLALRAAQRRWGVHHAEVQVDAVAELSGVQPLELDDVEDAPGPFDRLGVLLPKRSGCFVRFDGPDPSHDPSFKVDRQHGTSIFLFDLNDQRVGPIVPCTGR